MKIVLEAELELETIILHCDIMLHENKLTNLFIHLPMFDNWINQKKKARKAKKWRYR